MLHLWNRKIETHVRTCGEEERILVFPGKYYRDAKSIFDKLTEYGITTNNPYFDYFYEALLKPVETDNQWTAEHQAISVSPCSDVPVSPNRNVL